MNVNLATQSQSFQPSDPSVNSISSKIQQYFQDYMKSIGVGAAVSFPYCAVVKLTLFLGSKTGAISNFNRDQMMAKMCDVASNVDRHADDFLRVASM